MKLLIQYILLLFYAVCLTVAYKYTWDAGLLNLEIYGDTSNSFKLVCLPFFVLWISMCLPVHVQKPSGAFLWILAILLLIPGFVCFGYSAVSLKFVTMLFVLFIAQFLVVKNRSILVFRTKYSINPNIMAWSVVLFGIVLMLIYGNYSSLTFSLDKIYLNRSLIRESQFSLFGYMHPIISKSLLPFLLLFAVHKKKYAMASIVFFLSISMFFFTQHRAAFFFPFVCLAGYFLYQHFSSSFGVVLCVISSLIVISMTSILLTGEKFLFIFPDFVIRRSLIVPSVLQSVYIDYFSDHTFTYFSDSKLSLGLLHNPYKRPIANLIGDYIGLSGSHANAGILGTGFQQAGIAGVIFYTAILSIFVYLVDSLAPSEWRSVAFGTTLPGYLWITCSSDLPSVFLTHGLGVAMLLLFLLKYGKYRRINFGLNRLIPKTSMR